MSDGLEALRRSARVIVLLSPKAVASQNVLDEVSFAMDEGKTLVPVLVESCTIPMRLRRLQYMTHASARARHRTWRSARPITT